MLVGDDEQVAVGVGEAVEDDVVVLGAVDDVVAFVVLSVLMKRAEDASGRVRLWLVRARAFDVLITPRSPEPVHV